MKYRYVLKNKYTDQVHFKWYYLTQIEISGLSGLFNVENYDIITRDRFTGLLDKNKTKIFEGDKIKVHEGKDDYKIVEILWCKLSLRYYFDDVTMRHAISQRHQEHYEVVGSIHDKE